MRGSTKGRVKEEEEETGTRKKTARQRATEAESRGPVTRDGSSEDCSVKMDLDLLQDLERERVLEVLRRDKQLRIIEEDRIR